jgi:hypothetical protein
LGITAILSFLLEGLVETVAVRSASGGLHPRHAVKQTAITQTILDIGQDAVEDRSLENQVYQNRT